MASIWFLGLHTLKKMSTLPLAHQGQISDCFVLPAMNQDLSTLSHLTAKRISGWLQIDQLGLVHYLVFLIFYTIKIISIYLYFLLYEMGGGKFWVTSMGGGCVFDYLCQARGVGCNSFPLRVFNFLSSFQVVIPYPDEGALKHFHR